MRQMRNEAGVFAGNLREEMKSFLKEEDGVGTVEIILILVVLIGLVLIFKKQITKLVNNIFKTINEQADKV